MLWLRSSNPLDLSLYLLLMCAWAAGGWLIAGAAFKLRSGERLVAGLALGWVLWITLANLLAPLLGLPGASWGAALLLLAAGLGLLFWPRPGSPGGLRRLGQLAHEDFSSWPQLAALLVLTAFFAQLERSQPLFDDYLHLPLVSTMAAGNIPPHFYLNPSLDFAYHYALQVWAASLVRLAGFFPWGAWHLSKAFAIALTLSLGWLWARRLTNKVVGAALGSFLFVFGGGTRYLLLLLPGSILNRLSAHVQLINTGLDTAPNLAAALIRPWVIDGGGPIPFPFAYHNGVFTPVMFILGSTGALPFATILLLLLLCGRSRLSWTGAIASGLVLANLAFSAEHLFALLWAGVALALAIYVLRRRLSRARPGWAEILPWLAALALSALLSLVQGGFITVAAQSLLASLEGVAAHSGNLYGFALRWPPALYSAHLGILSLVDPYQLVVLLFEIGPALLLAPLATYFAWRSLKRGAWLTAGLGVAALLSILFPMFVAYGVDRSTTRFPGTALWLWLVLALPLVLRIYRKGNRLAQAGLAAGYGAVVFAGVVLFAVQVVAIPAPQISTYLDREDAVMSAQYWNRLPAGAQVFDPVPSRAVAVFGRISTANQSIYVPLEAWQKLAADPDPAALQRYGFSYVYTSQGWLDGLSPELREAFRQGCVSVVQQVGSGAEARVLLDIRNCR